MRLFPAPGSWSILAPIGIRRLSSSSELGAQNVESRVPAWLLCHVMLHYDCKRCCKRGSFRDAAQLHLIEMQSTRVPGTAGTAGLSEGLKNRKADCCTLLKRITILKCVNSEFRSVDINLTEEVSSLGPMAPCRSHHRNHTR